jgi:ABC-2 type transport system permease protein
LRPLCASVGWSTVVPTLRTYLALARAGFRRYTTYRQAMLAGAATNIVFGFLRCYALQASAVAAGGVIAGYRGSQLATYVWVSQGMIATVNLWGGGEQADRIRSGEVVTDLLRPVDPVWQFLSADLGRMCYAVLTRLAAPIVAGALAFDLYLPRHWAVYPLFAVSVVVATVISFGCQHVVYASVYWLLDTRGPRVLWSLTSLLLTGMLFPLWYLPAPMPALLTYGTPFPAIIQAPMDLLVERRPALGVLATQLAWLVVVLAAARLVQRRANRKLVIQGG